MAYTDPNLFEGRKKRVFDAINLKQPDRVPLAVVGSFLPAKYYGITFKEAVYDQDKWLAANKKFFEDFDTDMYMGPEITFIFPGEVLEIMDCNQYRWPGHGLGDNAPNQYVEGEYMKQDEYKEFLDDPSDFLFRKFIPRTFKGLQGFSMLPTLKTLVMSQIGMFSMPPVVSSLQTLIKGAQKASEWGQKYAAFNEEYKKIFVPAVGGISMAPFDVIGDFLRGTRGVMMDIYQCPDELLQAQEKVTQMCIDGAVQMANPDSPVILIPLHKGADGFMSNAQFEKFYWPGLKKVMLAIADAGLIPCPFYEGSYDQRVEYLQELPKGKTIGYFDRSDLFLMKEKLGDTMCIMGGMPVSMLQAASPEQIKDHTRRMIDVVGKDGGFIMTSSTVLDEAKPELVKVWIDATKEYGQYR